MMKPLYKTTIVIWTEYDPDANKVDLIDLARAATGGDAYCSVHEVLKVEHPERDRDWDETEFFTIDDVDKENMKALNEDGRKNGR